MATARYGSGRLARGVFATLCLAVGGPLVACSAPPPPTEAVPAATVNEAADAQLRDFQLADLEAAVRAMPEGVERTYFTGMLAARSGRFDEAIRDLARTLSDLRARQPKRAAQALETMATSYLATNDYAAASRCYTDLSEHFAGQLESYPDDDAALVRTLSGTPPTTITWQGPVRLETAMNPFGLPTAELTANGVRESWILDTGANQSVITQSLAARMGLVPLEGTVPLGSGVTGLRASAQVAVVPTLSVGGATLQHVAVMVLADEALRFGPAGNGVQLNAILGYPVLRLLGAITFTRDGEFRAGETERVTAGTPLRMRGLTPVVESQVGGQTLHFTLDTGASSTELSFRYFERFQQHASEWRKQSFESTGVGGTVRREFYIQPSMTIAVGGTTTTVKDTSTRIERADSELDRLFGNLGQDFFQGFERLSLDFQRMTIGAIGAQSR